MNSVLVRGIHGETLEFNCETIEEVLEKYSKETKIPLDVLRASQKSKPVRKIDFECRVEIGIRVLGGKGGFGSMLKGQGIIARVDNFESCRDLYGRRIRDVNNEIRMNEWKKMQEEKRRVEEESVPEVQLPVKRNQKVDKEFRKIVEKRKSEVKDAFAEGLKKARPS